MTPVTRLWPAALVITIAAIEEPVAREGINQREHFILFGDSLTPADSSVSVELKKLNEEVGTIKLQLQQAESTKAAESKTYESRKRVKFGLSLGYRWLTPMSQLDYVKASVSPLDSTLRLTQLESTAYLFSTSMIFDLRLGSLMSDDNITRIVERKAQRRSGKTFRAKGKKSTRVQSESTFSGVTWRNSLDRICLVSNLNILDFSSGQKELAFNKSIEGGLGIGYRINDSMYVGLNWEHVQSWQLYDDIKVLEGQKVMLNGIPLTSSNQLDTDNEDLYYKKSLNGWSMKMIIAL